MSFFMIYSAFFERGLSQFKNRLIDLSSLPLAT